MRAKVVVPVMTLSLLVVAVAFWFHEGHREGAQALSNLDGPPLVEAAQSQQPIEGTLAKTVPPGQRDQPPHPLAKDSSVQTDHATFVANRIAELNRLAMTSDPRSLDTILLELSNSDGQIRMAAVSAAIDFGSRDAISALQNALAAADDLKEKVEIQRAIDFLQLPSVLAQDGKPEERSAAR